MSDLRNGRGRIRCVTESGYWRDCGEWATKWVKVFDYFVGYEQYWPFCESHAAAIGDGE